MQQACEKYPGGMVSLMGMDEEKALALCEKVADAGRIGPANFNCPGQIVISGRGKRAATRRPSWRRISTARRSRCKSRVLSTAS